jgi:AraC family transcriptional regulator, positive regulator of tynA and feaB
MKALFSTADVDPRHRFDYWHDVACKKLVDHESTPKSRLDFKAAIDRADLGGLDLIVFENDAMDAARTSRNIAQAPHDSLLICRQLRGGVHIEQDSRQILLTAGELTILDPQRPYLAVYPSWSNMLLLKVPRSALEARVGRIGQITARPLRRENGIGALLSDHLALLPSHANVIDAPAAITAAAYTLDLIALAVVNLTGGAPRGRSAARSLAASRLRAFIEARLGDPTLGPSSVAAGIGCSVRYAQVLLAESGTSIVRLIQSRRLEQCERALADPAQTHRPVGEIAFAWGFSDLTHFCRLFKKRFGMTPREYRRHCLAQAGLH